MIRDSEYPILEFDPARDAKFSASDYLEKCLPERCVICFFREAVENFVRRSGCPVVAHLRSEIVDLPIYSVELDGIRCCLAMPFAGAPGAADTLEELHAMGAEKFIVCGGAGCLRPGMALGGLILPHSAVRDEGTSYHYLPPEREVGCDAQALCTVTGKMREWGIPFVQGKTWTTDGLFRETDAKIAKRLADGCISVEMECAAFFAVAKFYSLPLVQLLYAGDDLSREAWNSRAWNRQYSVRENLLELSLKLVMEI